MTVNASNTDPNDETVVNEPPDEIPPAANGTPRVEFASMTPRERALVDRARSEEKRKLYKDLEESRKRTQELERQMRELRNQPPPTTTAEADDQNTRLQRVERLLEQQNAQLDQFRQDEYSRRRRDELRAYRAEVIAEARDRGEDLIETMVGGESEEEIDNSLHLARAEYQFIAQREEEKKKRNRGAPANVTVQSSNGRPRGTAPVVTPNVVEAESNHEQIAELTSDAAVRDGTYAKNRTQLLGKFRRGYSYQGRTPAR